MITSIVNHIVISVHCTLNSMLEYVFYSFLFRQDTRNQLLSTAGQPKRCILPNKKRRLRCILSNKKRRLRCILSNKKRRLRCILSNKKRRLRCILCLCVKMLWAVAGSRNLSTISFLCFIYPFLCMHYWIFI